MIKLNLKTSGIDYKSKGETIDEALANLGMEWYQLKAKGVITIIKGKLKLEKLFIMGELRKIFANKITRATQAKRLELLLK